MSAAESRPFLPAGSLALIYGFVLLEINGQIRPSGNPDAAIDAALMAYLQGW